MGMGSDDSVILYAAQAEPVWQAICRDGVAYSRAEFVRKKYGESAPVFLTAYDWFTAQLPRFVPKPEGAAYPYWAFTDPYLMERAGFDHILKLAVPKDQAVFFRPEDWNRILQMEYLGRDEDAAPFRQELHLRGLRGADVMLSPFYPQLRRQILDSWQNLFQYHKAALQGERPPKDLQAGLWCIQGDWVLEDNGKPAKKSYKL